MAFVNNEATIQQMNIHTMYVFLCTIRNAVLSDEDEGAEWWVTTVGELTAWWDGMLEEHGDLEDYENNQEAWIEFWESGYRADFKLAAHTMIRPQHRQRVNLDQIVSVLNNREGFAQWIRNRQPERFQVMEYAISRFRELDEMIEE